MGTKTPKTTFEKLVALLSDEDMFQLQWPAAVKAAKTTAELDRLESLTNGSQDLLNDLFPQRMALVENTTDAALLVKKYPAFAGKIFEWVQKQELSEASVNLLVDAYPDWREALFGRLLHAANTSLGAAVEKLATAEDTVAETREAWGYSAAVARRYHVFAVEELRKAEQVLKQADALDDTVAQNRDLYNAAEAQYEESLTAVKRSRLLVARAARSLRIEEGPFVRHLREMSIEDMMEGAAYEDQQHFVSVDDSSPLPEAPAEVPAEPPSDLFAASAELPASEATIPGGNAQVSDLLDEHRPIRVVRTNRTPWQRFQAWLDAQ